jgi:hypothetical protein
MLYVRTRNQYRQLKNIDMQTMTQNKRATSIPAEASAAFEQHVRSLVGIARSGGAEVVLSSFATLHDPVLDYSLPEVEKKLSELQKREVSSLLYFTPGLALVTIFEGLKLYNNILRKIAIEEKTGWVDNARLVPHQDRYFVDRVHFSRSGAAQMANNFLPVVLERLRK